MTQLKKSALALKLEALGSGLIPPTIPFELSNLSQHINIVQKRYYLIGGPTGSGKTSFVDSQFVLSPLLWLKNHPESEIKLTIHYHSLERDPIYAHTRLACNAARLLENKIISPSSVLGETPHFKYRKDISDIITKYDNYITDNFGDKLFMYTSKVTPSNIHAQMFEYAVKNLGALFVAKDLSVMRQRSSKSTDVEHIADFNDTDFETDALGGKHKFIDFEYKGKPVRMYQHSQIFVRDDPNHFVLLIVDHIGRVSMNKSGKKKETIDELSQYLSNLRDLFGISVVAISQFNRAISETSRHALQKGVLGPQLEDFENTASTAHDSDLVLALFDPMRYKGALGGKGHTDYKGYNLAKMLASNGSCRFRGLSILKNSHGTTDVMFPLLFIGECGGWEALPPPDDFDDSHLDKVYEEIAKIRHS